MRFSNKIISWYNKNKRDLPWRNTNDPYLIWLSEIILQQTKVEQGLSYYLKFAEKYPTLNHLANASEQEVLKLWQGLGYYSRARNLHFTAKFLVENYQSKFPTKHNEILSLKGIGEYTAAAISSFAFNLPYPVIDGNVYRVLSRIYGIKTPMDSSDGKKIFKQLAINLIDKKNPNTYNQAIMEFGALQCIPKKPKCKECPFIASCYAFENDLTEILPVKTKKIKQKNRFFNYLVLKDFQENFYIKKRTKNDIWKNMYEFPLIETKNTIKDYEELLSLKPGLKEISFKRSTLPIKHILSHQKINAIFWEFSIVNYPEIIRDKELIKINKKEINKYPVAKLLENYLKTIL